MIPCEIGGKDYGQTFYDLGFSIWYSYLTLPHRRRARRHLGRGRRSSRSSSCGDGTERPGVRRRDRRGNPSCAAQQSASSLALSPIAITYTAGFIASSIGCDLNEVAKHPCTLLGMNIGPLLATMAQSIWFISLTVMAGLLGLVVLLIIFIVRTLKARRAKVDATGAKA